VGRVLPLVKGADEGLGFLRNGFRVLGVAVWLLGEPRERVDNKHQAGQGRETHLGVFMCSSFPVIETNNHPLSLNIATR
jgi:hypothetical protein